MTDVPVSATPTNAAEPTVQSKPEELLKEREAEIEKLKTKEVELQAQKEHWREKYERDIASKTTEPVPSEEPDVFSDEGKALKGEISSLNEKLRDIERKDARREIEAEYPVLKDKREDFDAFLEDEENKRLSVKKAAKLFLAEKNLLTFEPPERKGLEKPTGGGVTPPEPKLSNEEIEHLRKNDWRKFEKLLREGKI